MPVVTKTVVVEGLPEWDYIPAPEAVTHKVRETIARFQMLQPNETVVVGVSGGPDSLTLLHVLWRLRTEFGWQILAVHFNHGLRGEEADADEAFVKSFCERWGIPCVTQKADVKALARQWKLSVAQAGRRARYRFFAEVAEKVGATKVALGHTASDVVETLLLNLFRGTGLDGLQGIPPISPLTVWDKGQEGGSLEGARRWVVRPLISCWRAETEAYARVYRLQPRLDKSNLDTKASRNWIRWELLPLLRQRFEKVDFALWRLSEMAREESRWLHQVAEDILRALTCHADEGKIAVDRAELLRQPKALQRRILRRMVERLVGPLNEVSLEHIEEALGVVERHATGAAYHFPDQLFLQVTKGKVWLLRLATGGAKMP